VLAYHLLSQIELTLIKHGDKRRWSTIRDELSTHCRSTMVLTNDKGVVYHLRHSGAPEANHKEIYRMLGAVDPLPRLKTIAARRLSSAGEETSGVGHKIGRSTS
jgi:hypothetical protein